MQEKSAYRAFECLRIATQYRTIRSCNTYIDLNCPIFGLFKPGLLCWRAALPRCGNGWRRAPITKADDPEFTPAGRPCAARRGRAPGRRVPWLAAFSPNRSARGPVSLRVPEPTRSNSPGVDGGPRAGLHSIRGLRGGCPLGAQDDSEPPFHGLLAPRGSGGRPGPPRSDG